jgi:NTE family protein
LNELGLLSQIDQISSVSGGSIISAWLAHGVAEYGFPARGEVWADWDTQIVAPFRRFTQRGLSVPWLALQRFLPWNWWRPNADTTALARCYDQLNPAPLAQLPERPEFLFCATDLVFGVNWVFGRKTAGDYQAGYLRGTASEWRISQAVAASSCFPVVFAPMSLPVSADQLRHGHYRGSDRKELVTQLRLCDGGVYDNMGLEPVWKTRSWVLVSDGGSPFAPATEKGFLSRLARYFVVQSNQARTLRRRWLIANFQTQVLQGAFWGVSSAVESYKVQPGPETGYSKQLAKTVIGQVRTHLNSFSEAEIAVLENHGYFLAEAAAQRHLVGAAGSPHPPLTFRAAPLRAPHPEWMDEDRVRHHLA